MRRKQEDLKSYEEERRKQEDPVIGLDAQKQEERIVRGRAPETCSGSTSAILISLRGSATIELCESY